jgi:hypothetical protein
MNTLQAELREILDGYFSEGLSDAPSLGITKATDTHDLIRRGNKDNIAQAILAAIAAKLPKETAHGDDWQYLDAETQRLMLVRDNAIRDCRKALGVENGS